MIGATEADCLTDSSHRDRAQGGEDPVQGGDQARITAG